MNRRSMISMTVVTALGLALSASTAGSAPRAKIKKSQLVGDWALVSVDAPNATIQNRPNDGLIVFERSGRFSFALLSSNVPKFASNNRNTGTADENKAVVQGNISHFGTYSVADKVITLTVEGSTWPQWTGTDQKRNVISFTGDEIKWTVLPASIGGTAEVGWKRVK